MALKCVLEYDSDKNITSGSQEALSDATRRGADLSIYTEFRHNEHTDPVSDNSELVREIAQRGVTYLLDDRWSAGIITQRQPVSMPDRFGPRPSMSFFMYNQDGRQAYARPFLDGLHSNVSPNQQQPDVEASLPKLHVMGGQDRGTNAPSSSFTYEFDPIRYWVRDDWREVLSHGDDGSVASGSLNALVDAFAIGADLKVGIRGLCRDLAAHSDSAMDHEVFILVHSYYYFTETRQLLAATYPLVRIRPAIPLEYVSQAWDFGWVLVRTDGHTEMLLVDPYTLEFRRQRTICSVWWFMR